MQSEWVKFFDGACPPLGRLRRRVWAASQQREIRWVLADGAGNFREEDWASSQHSGRSAILLRSKLAHLTLQFCRLTLFIRAGRHGQPTPLVTDLPRRRERLDIVVIRADSAGQCLLTELVLGLFWVSSSEPQRFLMVFVQS